MFRVYDNILEQWVVDDVYLSPEGNLVMVKRIMGLTKSPIVLNKDKYTYHKSIGLKDMNRVEVFEGDYVSAKVDDNKEIVGLVAFAEELSAYVIFDVNSTEYFTLGSNVSDLIQIIGNVFDGCDDRKYN